MSRLNQLHGIKPSQYFQILPALLLTFVGEVPNAVAANASQNSHSGHASASQSKPDIKSTPKQLSEVKMQPFIDHSRMNHGQMDHSTMDHSKMDHSQMSHGLMDQQQTPASNHAGHHTGAANQIDPERQARRDPHAYSEGYTFGSMSHHQMGDEEYLASVVMDRLESVIGSRNTGLTYDWQAWFGKTYDRALIRAEGDINAGSFENARTEVLWAHALTPYWDSQLGIRYDSGRGTDRGWLALGMQGLAPYWAYTEATFYINEQGRTAFRLELEYDLLLTQRLILQPRTELNFYSERDASRGVSSGLSDVELGMRLRYEFLREFAPYLGVDWEYRPGQASSQNQPIGQTAVSDIRLVAGLHFWF